MFVHTLRQFLTFFNANPTYVGIAESLSRKFPNTDYDINHILSDNPIVGNTEEESAALGYGILKRIVTQSDVYFYSRLTRPYDYTETKLDESLEFIRHIFLEPFYEYVDEQLDDQGIDFSIEPSSISGEVDLISAQGSVDPLLADSKIFDGDGRGKTYIRKAFNQIYTLYAATQ